MDGVPVTDAGDLQRLMTGELIGRTIHVRVIRGEATLDLPSSRSSSSSRL